MAFFAYGLEEMNWLRRRDSRLGKVIGSIPPVKREVDEDIFSSILHHIIGQQISTKAQRTVRMQDAYGIPVPSTIAKADINELQSLGMTFKKATCIKEFVENVQTGVLSMDALKSMPDAEAIAALTKIRGIGVWTAEMILLFGLHRPDILSYGDLAIHRGMRMVYHRRNIGRDMFEKYRRRFSPYCSVASLYFWAVAGGAIPELTDPAPKKK